MFHCPPWLFNCSSIRFFTVPLSLFYFSTIRCSTVLPSLFHCSTIICSTVLPPLFHCGTISCSTVPLSDVLLFHHLFSTVAPSDVLVFHHLCSTVPPRVFYCSTFRCLTLPPCLFLCFIMTSGTSIFGTTAFVKPQRYFVYSPCLWLAWFLTTFSFSKEIKRYLLSQQYSAVTWIKNLLKPYLNYACLIFPFSWWRQYTIARVLVSLAILQRRLPSPSITQQCAMKRETCVL